MSYQFIQQVQASANTSNSNASTSFTITPNKNDYLIVAYTYTSPSKLTGITISDTIGINSYTSVGNFYDPTTQVEIGFWYCPSCDNSATQYVANFPTSVTRRGVAVFEYAGIEPSFVPLGYAVNMNVNPGSGTNACVSGTAGTAYLGSYMVFGFTLNVSALDTQSSFAGSGFTSRGAVWDFGGSTGLGRPEDQRVTSPGSNTATFTANTGTDTFMSSVILLGELNLTGRFICSM